MSERFKVIDQINHNDNLQFINVDILDSKLTPFTSSLVIFGRTSDDGLIAAKFSTMPGGAEREWRGLVAIHNVGVSVPRPIALVKNNHEQLGLVSSFVQGYDLITNQHPRDHFNFGGAVKSMHDLVQTNGAEWTRLGKNDFAHYDRYINHCGDLIKNGVVGSKRGHELLKLFAAALGKRLGQLKPTFTHYDLHDKQVIIDSLSKLHLIDFERWREGDPLDDLAIYLFHSLRMNRPYEFFIEFTRGYLNNAHFTDMEKSVINFYLLYSGFMSVDYFRRFRESELPFAIAQMDKVVQYVSEERLMKTI